MMREELSGTVHSHTVIRVPGKQHAGGGPFVLLLIGLDDGRRVLGRFEGLEPPPIHARVVGSATHNGTPVFSLIEGKR
jgi:uncharacterized OB-fold protein